MWVLLVLVAKTQAFGPVSVQWAGQTARNFVLAPRGLARKTAVAGQSLIVIHRPSSTSIPQFTFNTDRTITVGSMDWCVDAAVGVGRNRDEVRISRCNGASTQKFNLVDHSIERRSQIQLAGTNTCLTTHDVIHEDNAVNGSPIVLRDCDDKVSASWQFEETSLVPSHGLLPYSVHSFTLRHALISFVALALFGTLSLSRGLRLWQTRSMLVPKLGCSPLNVETGGVALTPISAVVQGGSPLRARVDMKEQEMATTKSSKLPVMLVTGASYGVGGAIAKHFSTEFQICALARNEQKLRECASAAANPENVTTFPVDVSDKAAVSAVSKEILDKFGMVNILVNNAAVITQKNLVDLTLDECDAMIDVNLKGTVYVTKAILPSMIASGGGKIIMINSVAGLPTWTVPTETIYCASKHGQTGFAHALANEVREHGITVTSIHPGGIDTPLQARAQCPRDVAEKFLTVEDLVESVEYIVKANPKTLVKTLNMFRSAFWH